MLYLVVCVEVHHEKYILLNISDTGTAINCTHHWREPSSRTWCVGNFLPCMACLTLSVNVNVWLFVC